MNKNCNITLIGYFNGSKEDPEITFNLPESSDDNRQLMIITMKPVPKSKKINNTRKQEQEVKKIRKELRNLKLATERLKK